MVRALSAAMLALSLAGAPSAAATAPDWTDEIIYFVMTDRFHNGDPANDGDARPSDPRAYHGGDLAGLRQKLDYIRDLGATAIWITPVVDNERGGYHGYWAADFYAVDEHLGTLEDLQALVRNAHDRGLKVILDYVVNHTGYNHPWLRDPAKAAWFHDRGDIRNWGDQTDIEQGRLAGLPDLAQENPEVARYFIENALWWIEQTGIDGFRLDTVRHVPVSYWEQFTAAIRDKHPNFFFLGEAWNESYEYLATYQKAGIDVMIDFARYSAIRSTFGSQGRPLSLEMAESRRKALPRPDHIGIFVDNHDVERFVSVARSPGEQRLRLALTYLFTSPGIPILNYGTEVGLEGGRDPYNRRDMSFDSNPELTGYVRQLTRLRRENEALRRGNGQLLDAGKDIVAFLRSGERQQVLVVINNSPAERVAVFEKDSPVSLRRLTSLLEPGTVAPRAAQSFRLQPFEVRIYEVGAKGAPIAAYLSWAAGLAAASALAFAARRYFGGKTAA